MARCNHYKDHVVIPLDHVIRFKIVIQKWEKVVESLSHPGYFGTNGQTLSLNKGLLVRSTMSIHASK